MRWLTLAGLASGVLGALLAAVYPFERLKGMIGELTEGAFHDYTQGVPLSAELRRQPRQLKAGLLLIVLGALLAAAGTLWGK